MIEYLNLPPLLCEKDLKRGAPYVKAPTAFFTPRYTTFFPSVTKNSTGHHLNPFFKTPFNFFSLVNSPSLLTFQVPVFR